MRRLFHVSWITLTALLLIPAAALYWLAWTESGLTWLTHAFSRRIGRTEIQIDGAHGTLVDGFTVARVIVDHPHTRVEVDDAQGEVRLLPLIWQSIHVPRVHAARLLVQVRRSDDDSPSRQRFLPGLMSIHADQARVDTFTLVAPNGWSGEFDHIDASGVLHARDIRVYSASAGFGPMQLRASGDVTASLPTGLSGSGRATMPAQGSQPAWLAEFAFNGNLDKLELNGDFRAPFTAHVSGAMLTMTTRWHWQAAGQLTSLDLRAFGAGNALGVMSGKLQMDGDVQEFRARGSIAAPGLDREPLQVEFAGDYRQRTLNAHRIRVLHASSGSLLTGAGPIGIDSGGARLGLSGEVQNLRWPLGDSAAPVQEAQGRYRIEGIWPYRLHAEGSFRPASLPVMTLNMDSSLEHQRLVFRDARVQWLQGSGLIGGEVRWQPALGWSLQGSVANLDLAQLRPLFNSRLGGTFTASGRGAGADASRELRISELTGTVRGQRASGHAALSSAGENWLFRDVRLQLGATHIEADGQLGATTNLHFALNAENLALLQTDAQGQLSASGTFRGDARHPVLKAQASGTGIKWDAYRLGTLRGNVEFDTQGSGRADLQLHIDNLSLADRLIDRVEVTTSGTVGNHRDTLSLTTPQLSVRAAGNGAFDEGEWRVAIDELQATDGKDLHLSLEAPASVLWSAERFAVAQLCLHDGISRICGSADGDARRSQARVSAQSLPLQTLTAGLTPDTDYDGTLTVEASGSMLADGPWNGSLRATLGDAAISHRLASGKVEKFPLGSGAVNIQLDPQLWRGDAALDAGQTGTIKASVSAQSNGSQWRSWPVGGSLTLHTAALPYLESYFTDIDRAAGTLDGDLQLAGTVEAPRFNGRLSLGDGEFDLYELNLALRAVSFNAQLQDNRLTIDGSARAGSDGTARVTGSIDWRERLPWGTLHLQGSDLRIVNIPEARVLASPDVDLQLKGRRIEVGGTVLLPYARLEEAEQLASARLASSDEVMVGATRTPPDQRFIVTSNITLKLGDRVTLNTRGLSGRLSGSLSVSSDESGISRGAGELNVEEGKYSAYGRKLDIERGRLLFGNGLLTDPGVDLRATKQFPDVIAGVNVRGTLRAPRMTFFSEPALTQSQIVSLLLAGGSLESVQSDTDTASGSNSARANALLQGGAIVAQQFGSKVGIEDVSVESDLNNETSLVLGRYLSPRLYISYGISLAEAINTFKMRYTLGDHWTIKTEAGTVRSADLVYTIEH